ncbi:hydroxyquinol 1,2-dioxygenase [Pseudomonas salomonii]|uniref:Hydroxyquinol 1,2-dioxygenase n=1 Tax=Pseudomonas salomonii TaxID=191391 RepID=A0A7Y8GIZ2_9PSED|nr:MULTISPECIES: hydroxyquinol 1,2-dioxygenase [Pseudomonas]NWF10893.1 hydroxyquinol 1,2-dioxygenase [Pseudomonas salomonii]CRM55026.1 hypothetical protein [Pseudomonas sp. 58 R 3]
MYTAFSTSFGSLENHQKGSIEIIQGDARHYAFSNVFDVASKSAPYEKVVVGLNMEYVIETIRAEGVSPWYTCSHDECVISLDGEVRVDFLKLDVAVQEGDGTRLAGESPKGKPMGYILLARGHQCLLPAGCAYRFESSKASTLVQQTIRGPLSVEKWEAICEK